MEELKSTDALDKEILEDARKKAERLLRNADQAAEAAAHAWAKKAEADIAELERKHAARVAEKRKETLARLPLDKRRERARRAELLLRRAMTSYLASLPRQRLLSLVRRDLAARVGELGGDGLVVTAAAFAAGELEGLLAEVLGARSWTLAPPSPGDPADHPSDDLGAGLPSLVVEGGDVRVRVSVAAAAEDLLREKRAELAAALLGAEAAND